MKRLKLDTFSTEAKVAPRAGAWIETSYHRRDKLVGCASPPARGRGLKPDPFRGGRGGHGRPPRGGVD